MKSDHHLGRAALTLIAQVGWEGATPERLAKAAGIPLAQVRQRIADRHDLIPLMVDFISAEMVTAVGAFAPQGSPRERLFEVMMARFDILQEYRPAILSILAALPHDAKLGCSLIRAQHQAAKAIIGLAKLDRQGLGQPIVPAGVLAVYAGAARVWQNDQTLDMSKTMAALDRYLRYAERAAGILWREI